MRYILTIYSALFILNGIFKVLSAQGIDITDRTSDTNLLQREVWQAGIVAGAQFNMHSAGFQQLPGVPSCCPEYQSGNGFSLTFGGAFEVPLTERWSTGVRLLYSSLGGTLRTEEHELVFDGASSVNGTFEHEIDASLSTLLLEPIALFNPIADLQLFAGPQISIGLRSHFEQAESILSPQNIRYENDRRSRLEFSGRIPNSSTLGAALIIGARYELPWQGIENVVFLPEISGWYRLTNIADRIDWKVHGIRIGFSALYKRYPATSIPKEEEPELILPPTEDPVGPTGAGG